jgi:hypothetical protein
MLLLEFPEICARALHARFGQELSIWQFGRELIPQLRYVDPKKPVH